MKIDKLKTHDIVRWRGGLYRVIKTKAKLGEVRIHKPSLATGITVKFVEIKFVGRPFEPVLD